MTITTYFKSLIIAMPGLLVTVFSGLLPVTQSRNESKEKFFIHDDGSFTLNYQNKEVAEQLNKILEKTDNVNFVPTKQRPS